MGNKTLQDFKNEVASTFRNFDGSECNWDDFKFKASSYIQLQYLEMAAVRYASHLSEQACIKQRELCAKSAKNAYQHEMIFEEKFRSPSVLFDKIMNTPLAIELNKD